MAGIFFLFGVWLDGVVNEAVVFSTLVIVVRLVAGVVLIVFIYLRRLTLANIHAWNKTCTADVSQ